METNALEALKLLADWSKWLASTQTVVISLIGVASASGRGVALTVHGPVWLVLALTAFLISLLAAAFLLYALPGIAQRLPPPPNCDILSMGTYRGVGIKVVVFSTIQFAGFGLGVIFLAIWAIVQVLSPAAGAA
jgi:hypothetical protein